MKFDKIIMNPPYCKNLHFKVLEKAIENLDENGRCVDFSPIPCITSIRNVWNELAIKKFNNKKIYKHLESCEQIDGLNCIKMFGACMQQHMGITVYSKNKQNDINSEKYVNTFGISTELIQKIMKKCLSDSLRLNHGHGKFCLPISGIHGHINNSDFLNIMSLTYEDQLKSKGAIKVYFETEDDRHDFYNFWMSLYGKFLVRFWKVDTHVMENFIPYFWCKDLADFQKYFDLSEDEMTIIKKNIETTME